MKGRGAGITYAYACRKAFAWANDGFTRTIFYALGTVGWVGDVLNSSLGGEEHGNAAHSRKCQYEYNDLLR